VKQKRLGAWLKWGSTGTGSEFKSPVLPERERVRERGREREREREREARETLGGFTNPSHTLGVQSKCGLGFGHL
jgi:hypothetical protein